MKPQLHRLFMVCVSLAALSGCYQGVSYSPDGKRLVLADGKGLHIVKTDGSGKTEHITNEGTSPCWSPDGRRIAYEVSYIKINGTGPKDETRVYDTQTRQSRRVTDEFTGPYTWREDGSRIAGIHKDPKTAKSQLIICDPQDGTVVSTTDLPADPDSEFIWIPHTDSQAIIAGSRRDVYLVDGNECRKITTTGNILGVGVTQDGSSLLWVHAPSEKTLSGWEVFSYGLKQQRPARLPFVLHTPMPPPRRGYKLGMSGVKFAPDGKHMLVIMVFGDLQSNKKTDKPVHIVCSVMRLDGSDARVVRMGKPNSNSSGDIFDVTWSQTGNSFALQEFISNHRPNRLFVYDSDGRNGRIVYTEPVN